ncbi:hypothetical protein MVEN_01304100 [Mycena venus]|uniref:Uncharacterized protein n=1 Tax=Mycena venus TaxID=2733690 RepID=A0A8H6Y097_9AGAR|nr:hypothetical protein MVEN_01304100 [Mycena venus]
MRFFCFMLSLLVPPSSSFFLTGPDTALSGESIQFNWTREAGDPVSFGLMQRSLAGNAPILSINGVPNEAGATTGTASVVFQTAGQIILSGVDQLSLDPAAPPNQLAPGKQLTIAESGSNLDTTTQVPPIEPTSTKPESTPDSTPTLTPTIPTTTSATTSPAPVTPTSSNQVADQPPVSFSSTTFGAGLVNPKPQQSTIRSTEPFSSPGENSADPSASTTPKTSPSEQDQSTVVPPHSEQNSQSLTQIPESPESSGTSIPSPAGQHAASRSGGGPNKQVLIAAVVTVFLLPSLSGGSSYSCAVSAPRLRADSIVSASG